jgi:hypothetical protein
VTSFAFPKPGERTNASAVAVPPHTLIALVAGALAWEIDTGASFPGTIPPQLCYATWQTLLLLDDTEASQANQIAERLMRARTEAEQV